MDEALAAVGDAASPARCLLLTHKTVRAVPLAQSAAARAAADAAVDTARLLDDPAAVPFALVARMWSLLGSPVRPELRDAPADALAFTAPPELGVSLRVFVVPMLPMVPLHMGERAEVDAVRDTVAADPHTRGSKHLAAYVQMWDGALALAAGRLDVAEHLATTILAAGDSSVWADVSALQTIVVGMERGDPTVGFRLEAYLSVVQRSDVAQSLLTSLAAAAGDQALAYRHIDVLRRATPDDLGWCAPLTYRHLAEAAAHLGDRELAAELLPETSRYAGQLLVSFAATTLDAAADRAIGQNLMVLGRLDEAVERLRSARAFEQAFGADALAARSGYWLARALLDRRGPGDGDAARRLLHEAAAEAQKLGMEGLHRDLQVVLAAGG